MKRLAYLLFVLLLVGCTHTNPPGAGTEKPPVDAQVVIELSAADQKTTIKPGESARLPATTISALVRFSAPVDWSSVRPKVVDSAGWNVELKNRPSEANAYYFLLRPDRGASDTATITIDGVRGADGKPLVSSPLVFYVRTLATALETTIDLSVANTKMTIKPGETAKLPVGTVGVMVHFPQPVDWYSVQPKVEPASWHFESKNRVPEANLYYFLIRPDDGGSGKVTVTIDKVAGADGHPVLTQPLIFYVETSQGGR